MKEVKCRTLAQFKLGTALMEAGIELENIQALEWLSGNAAKVTGHSGFYMIVRLVGGLLELDQEEESKGVDFHD